MPDRRCFQRSAVVLILLAVLVAEYHSAQGATLTQTTISIRDAVRSRRDWADDVERRANGLLPRILPETDQTKYAGQLKPGGQKPRVKRPKRSTSRKRMDQNPPASQVVVNAQQEACILQCSWDCHNFSCLRKCTCKSP